MMAVAGQWVERASCADDPERNTWFPHAGQTIEAERAVRVCLGCPVRNECLQYALERQEPHGIWGGLTETERKRLAS